MPRMDAGLKIFLSKIFTLGIDIFYTANARAESPAYLSEMNETLYYDYGGPGALCFQL